MKMISQFSTFLKSLINSPDFLAILLIALIIILPYIPVFKSGNTINSHDTGDFLQYSARHRLVRKSILQYHTFPLRSQFFGGGYPTLGDSEDPSLNPLVLISLAFREIFGLKIIILFGMLVGSLGMYAKRWCHFAATAAKKGINVYVNGELEKTVKVQGGLLKVAYNESGISIGANQGKSNFFSGKIDEFRIWSRVLNADEIENASSGTLLDKLSVKVSELEGLLLYFLFDDGKGNKAKDLSKNDFNGELNGPKWVPGKFGKALEFDGKDDFVKVEPIGVEPDEITIEFLFSPAKNLVSSDFRMDIVYALNGVSRPHITFNRANEINPGAIGFYPEFYSYRKNPSYRGEFFFLNSVNTASGIFRPNSITVKVRVKEPDVLVINQNFHQDWHTDKGTH